MITSRELVDLVEQVLTNPVYVEQINEEGLYSKLMKGILGQITEVCGAEVHGDVRYLDDDSLFYVHVAWNEDVPDSGGIWDRVDTDVDWT